MQTREIGYLGHQLKLPSPQYKHVLNLLLLVFTCSPLYATSIMLSDRMHDSIVTNKKKLSVMAVLQLANDYNLLTTDIYLLQEYIL